MQIVGGIFFKRKSASTQPADKSRLPIGTLSFQSCQNPPCLSSLSYFERFDTSSRKPTFSRSLSEPSAEVRQRQSAGGPSTPKKKKTDRKPFKKDLHNNVQKPSFVCVLLFSCGAFFSVSPFTQNLCFGFAVTLCDNPRSVRGVCAVHKVAQMAPAFFFAEHQKESGSGGGGGRFPQDLCVCNQ